MKRIFAAIKILPDKNFIQVCSTFKSVLSDCKITWVNLSDIHITLAFLGNIADEQVFRASDVLRKQCTGKEPFTIRLSGIGVFKSPKDPRIIWVGIEKNDDLINIGNSIQKGLRDSGFKIEERPFSPHITLGRVKFVKDTKAFESLLRKFDSSRIQNVQVREVILYESILKQTGPLYIPVEHFSL